MILGSSQNQQEGWRSNIISDQVEGAYVLKDYKTVAPTIAPTQDVGYILWHSGHRHLCKLQGVYFKSKLLEFADGLGVNEWEE